MCSTPGRDGVDVTTILSKADFVIVPAQPTVLDLRGSYANSLVMIALERVLKEHGRPAISELAPWFPDYLMRQGRTPREREPPAHGDFD